KSSEQQDGSPLRVPSHSAMQWMCRSLSAADQRFHRLEMFVEGCEDVTLQTAIHVLRHVMQTKLELPDLIDIEFHDSVIILVNRVSKLFKKRRSHLGAVFQKQILRHRDREGVPAMLVCGSGRRNHLCHIVAK